jgi:hypothetical protein
MESPVWSSPGADRRQEVDQVPEPKLMTLKGARSNPVLPWWPGNAQDRRSSPRFRRRPAKVRNRRILLVAVHSGGGPLTEHKTATQAQPPERVFMPHSGPYQRPIRRQLLGLAARCWRSCNADPAGEAVMRVPLFQRRVLKTLATGREQHRAARARPSCARVYLEGSVQPETSG